MAILSYLSFGIFLEFMLGLYVQISFPEYLYIYIYIYIKNEKDP